MSEIAIPILFAFLFGTFFGLFIAGLIDRRNQRHLIAQDDDALERYARRREAGTSNGRLRALNGGLDGYAQPDQRPHIQRGGHLPPKAPPPAPSGWRP